MVLVTGGTGFVGAYIIKELVEKGYAVRALRRKTGRLPFFIAPEIVDKVEWIDGDVLDVMSLEDAMDGAEAIFHSAAMVSFKHGDREDMMRVNIEGTANVANTALEKNIKRFVHISSVAALGRTKSGETVTEKKTWEDTAINTNYAISKYRAEIEIWRAIAEGLNTVILNPSTIVGYGDWNTSSCAIFKSVYQELPYYTNGVNGFVYIDDVAKAAVHLYESGISNERFIINSDNWSFRQLLNTIADGLGKKRPHRHATPFLSAIAWRAEKLKSLITGNSSVLTRETARIAQTKTYFDNNKILSALPGFRFTPLEEGVKVATKKYLANIQ
jgi:nucleoside-diphosphate-sugar epimerase